jgi:hypothetical protein
MKKLHFVVMMIVMGLLMCSCSDNLTKTNSFEDSLNHENFGNHSITIQKVENGFKIIGDYSVEQMDHYIEMSKYIDNELCLAEGESFIILLEDFEEGNARYCTGGHDLYSPSMRWITQHTVKIGDDYWLCYVYAFTYKCKKCDYFTTVIVHTLQH